MSKFSVDSNYWILGPKKTTTKLRSWHALSLVHFFKIFCMKTQRVCGFTNRSHICLWIISHMLILIKAVQAGRPRYICSMILNVVLRECIPREKVQHSRELTWIVSIARSIAERPCHQIAGLRLLFALIRNFFFVSDLSYWAIGLIFEKSQRCMTGWFLFLWQKQEFLSILLKQNQ